MKPAAMVAVVFLGLVSLAHVIRLVLQVEVLVGGAVIPIWVSLFGVFVPGGLAIWLWREERAPG
jgi:hypothetical protein